jgi:hypothetical protein
MLQTPVPKNNCNRYEAAREIPLFSIIVRSIEMVKCLQDATDGPKTKMQVSEKGIALVCNEGNELDTPLKLLHLPAKVGDSWDSKGPPPFTEYTSKIVGEETVEVPAGKFNAIGVDNTISLGTEHFQTMWWFAPGVGVLKMAGQGKDTDQVVVLKSFTPGK